MAKKKKIHKIHSFEQLGEILTEDNFGDIMKCLTLSALVFIKAKETEPKLKFIGMNWKDDKKNILTSFNVIKSK